MLDALRFVGILTFMLDWVLKYSYFLHTRFITIDLYDVFKTVLIVRVVFVFFVHANPIVCGIDIQRHSTKRGFGKTQPEAKTTVNYENIDE